LHELSQRRGIVNLQSLVISGAETLSNQFAESVLCFTDLEDQTYIEAQETIQDVNMMTAQIAELNDRISSLAVRGKEPTICRTSATR